MTVWTPLRRVSWIRNRFGRRRKGPEIKSGAKRQVLRRSKLLPVSTAVDGKSLIPSSNIPGRLWDLNQQSSGLSP